MDALDDLRTTFFQECEELLEVLESGLIDMNEGQSDDETVHAVFRAAHSIKGGAGAFALDELVHFAHTFETALDEVRSDNLEASPEVLQVFLRASDMLTDLVGAARDGTASDEAAKKALLADLEEMIPASDEEEEEVDFQPMGLDFDFDLDGDDEAESGDAEEADEPASTTRRFEITFRPMSTLYRRGNETALLLRALSDLGQCETVCDAAELPSLDELDPEESFLEWKITLDTEADADAIEEVFEFAEADCELEIREIGAAATDEEPGVEIDAADADVSDENVIDLSALTDIDDEPETVETAEADAPEEVVQEAVEEATPAGAAEAQSAPAAAQTSNQAPANAPRPTIRVDLDRVERLINLVGELVINQAMLSQQIQQLDAAQAPEIMDGLDEFKQLTRDIQDGVMAIRAQPVKPLFQRMSRIVREAAQATGKTVRLVSEGEATEVDKTVIERLADPLTHMIRNAVDHGLETPEKREEAGKSEAGVVRLTAAHRSGRVVIEVSDDGAGINRERVRQKAIDKGLIPADATLSNSEIDNLLFMPGFSTAGEISNLSGRGVGMDVVKRSIQSLGGRISISSEPGRGSTFSISLPLTLAILDGIMVGVADQSLVVPLNHVVETLKLTPGNLRTIGGTGRVVTVRDSLLPLVDVGYELGFRPKLDDFDKCIVLVTENEDGAQSAVVVDEIHDQRQVVIKGLETNYGDVPGISAATILGDGRIALILDLDTLVKGAPPSTPELAMAG